MNHKPKILFLVTEDWYFCSHRLPIACAARDKGFEVVVATRVQKHAERIKREGFKLIPIRLRRRNRNPVYELLSLMEIVRIYNTEHPDIVHHVAMQPILYGTIAARITRTPAVVNALTGMGYVFTSPRIHVRILKIIMKIALKLVLGSSGNRVIVQNPDDFRMLEREGIIKKQQIVLIKGSGVDVGQFSPGRESNALPTVVLASRMLWDKGIKEFVAAAALLKRGDVKARFVLVGDSDPANPSAIPVAQLEKWHASGAIEWFGYREDMEKVFEQSSIVCLPSYREGAPKVLIEAAACGRPIVATDVPGCREIVRHGENGLLVPSHDSVALAEALLRLIDDASLRQRMGNRGREIAMAEFSIEKVSSETLAVYNELLKL